jgi:hypothetical protein
MKNPGGSLRREKQIPPLRCGMTTKRTGNGKNKSNDKKQRRKYGDSELRSE